jgi:hypothetical protein
MIATSWLPYDFGDWIGRNDVGYDRPRGIDLMG